MCSRHIRFATGATPRPASVLESTREGSALDRLLLGSFFHSGCKRASSSAISLSLTPQNNDASLLSDELAMWSLIRLATRSAASLSPEKAEAETIRSHWAEWPSTWTRQYKCHRFPFLAKFTLPAMRSPAMSSSSLARNAAWSERSVAPSVKLNYSETVC